MKKLNEEKYDVLTPIPIYTLVKVIGKNKLFLIDPEDNDNAIFMEGLLSEIYRHIDGEKTIQSILDEIKSLKKVDRNTAGVLVGDAMTELMKHKLIKVRRK